MEARLRSTERQPIAPVIHQRVKAAVGANVLPEDEGAPRGRDKRVTIDGPCHTATQLKWWLRWRKRQPGRPRQPLVPKMRKSPHGPRIREARREACDAGRVLTAAVACQRVCSCTGGTSRACDN